MTTTTNIDWPDVESAARELAGNWQKFSCFVWFRASDLDEPDQWMVWYTSSRDAGLVDQSNESVINKRLQQFTEGDDPDLVIESHSHWAVGHVDGFSIRVFRKDGTITDAFREFCRLHGCLEDYPILDEDDYSEREYGATLENYDCEMWGFSNELPEGWESKVYAWFSDHGLDCHTDNRDGQGGWAPREAIIEALTDLGLLPTVVVED
jgi:hypothetical protein